MVILSDREAEAIAAALDDLARDGAVTPARIERLRRLLSLAPAECD